MSSSLTLISAISPCLIGLAFTLPFFYGYVGKKWYSALTIGWSLFILSSLLNPVYARLIQIEIISYESNCIVETSDPNLILIISLGWLMPLCGYFLGKKLSQIKKNRS